ncbi:MAG: hypothetical protein ABEJ06_02890 [Haloarculaceae archaeon]
MATGSEYEFRCSECAEEITVNASMREALLEHGCVICGAPATDSSFVALP